MIWKILIFVAIIAAVLAGFKYLNRPVGGGRSGREKQSPPSRPEHSDGQSVDLVKCDNCGAFIAPQSVCGHCGQ